MPKIQPDTEKITKSRDKLLALAAGLQAILDGEETQSGLARKLDMTPQAVSSQLTREFRGYVRTKILNIPDLIELLDRARTPAERLLMDIFLGEGCAPKDELVLLPDFNEDLVWEVAEDRLTHREYRIVCRAYGHGDLYETEPENLGKIAMDENVTKERVRQIHHKALRKLRKPVSIARLLPMVTPQAFDLADAMRRNAESARELFRKADEDYRNELETKGKIELLQQALALAKRNRNSIDVAIEAYAVDEPPKPIRLEDAEPSVRTYNCLTRAGINTLDELLDMDAVKLMSIRNMGRASCAEVRMLIRKHFGIDRTDLPPENDMPDAQKKKNETRG